MIYIYIDKYINKMWQIYKALLINCNSIYFSTFSILVAISLLKTQSFLQLLQLKQNWKILNLFRCVIMYLKTS